MNQNYKILEIIMVRRLIPNYDFIMNVSDDFVNDFINVPIGISNILIG